MASEPTLPDFKGRFPPPAFTTDDVDTYLPNLIKIYSCYYGGNYGIKCDREIILELLAHLLVGEISGASTDPLQMQSNISVGDVSVGYVSPTVVGQNEDFFNSTKYGRRYLQLISFHSGGKFV